MDDKFDLILQKLETLEAGQKSLDARLTDIDKHNKDMHEAITDSIHNLFDDMELKNKRLQKGIDDNTEAVKQMAYNMLINRAQ